MMGTELFPAFFTGIFLVVVLAAIMSTVDSLLILASSAVVRDVIQKTFNPPWTDKVFSRWGKLTTVVIGAVAVALALQEVRVIFWFVLFAWSGLASAFTPVAHEQPPAVEAESVPLSLPEARRRGVGIAPCTNLQELIFGSRWDIEEALERARSDLARTRGEKALFELSVEQPSRLGRVAPNGSLEKAAYYTARAVGWLLGNDRLAGCLNGYLLGV